MDFGSLECRGAKNVAEVVLQDDMADCAARDGMYVSGARPRLSRSSLPQRKWLRRAVLLEHLRRRVRCVRRCHSERPRRRRILL